MTVGTPRDQTPAFAVWDAVAAATDKATIADMLEDFVEALYRRTLSPGDVTFDVGAHRGRHTLPMASCVGAQGRVIAVEASSTTLEKLRATLSRADAGLSDVVTVVDKAVGREPGSATFHYVPQAPGMSGLREQNYPKDATPMTEMVEIVRLDDVATTHGVDPASVRFIKLDIEGGEFDALCGARTILEKGRPVFVYEWGGAPGAERFGFGRDDFFGFMDAVGYQLHSALGPRHTPDQWGAANVYYFAALPKERPEDVERVLLPATIGALAKHLSRRDA